MSKIDLTKCDETNRVPDVHIVYSEQPPAPQLWDSFQEDVMIITKKRDGMEVAEINEPVFARGYAELNRLRYCNGLFYSPHGVVHLDTIGTEIFDSIADYCPKGTAQKAKALLEALKLASYRGEFKEDITRIPFANGDLVVSAGDEWTFYDDSYNETPYRLPIPFVSFDTEIPTPYFDKWLSDLFEPEDILTVQEYLGYCLLPTTNAQEALFLIGDGGTGKSVIKKILESVFGNAMVDAQRGVQEFLGDKFQIPELEFKLVLYDDEIQESALTSSSFFKKLITNTGYITADRKFGQPFKFRPYVRVIACGNFMLSSLYDSTDGFFRRLHPILCKPKDPKRKIIKGFEELVAAEADGIAQWMLVGLYRLLRNNYNITMTDRTKDYLTKSKSMANHFPEFLDTVFQFGGDDDVSSVEISEAYRDWCKANSIVERNPRALQRFLTDNAERYGLKQSQHIKRNGKEVRGYKNMSVTGEWRRIQIKLS